MVTLAALLAFAVMAVAHTPRAEAHRPEVSLIDCRGWTVDLWAYDASEENSVEIWVDGDPFAADFDFGREYHDGATWSSTTPHTLRVRVVAGDGPTNPNWSFDRTLTSVACPEPPDPSIDIEKATNGQDADGATGPQIAVGAAVTWAYVVTNTGNVDLTGVVVTDDVLGDICEIGDLAVGATETCNASGTATLGQYANNGTVVDNYGDGPTVSDTDPSHYLGVETPPPPVETVPPPPVEIVSSIHIEKYTNDEAADAWVDAKTLISGAEVTWTYVVTNDGEDPLRDVTVTDDQPGVVPVYQIGDTNINGFLDTTETWTFGTTGTVGTVDYENLGTVTGTGLHSGDKVKDTDPSHYKVAPQVKGTAQLGDTVWLDANNNGVQDNDEVGYNGADVILKHADGSVVGTLTTATGAWVGFYKFVGLDAGTYTAMLDLSTIGSYGVTTANSFTITLAEGEEYLDADFGLYQAPPTTTVPPEETLPATGAETEGMALLGLGLLILGALAILATRKRRTTD